MRPNIIFFLIDGLRADQCYGKDKTSVTPNLDGLIQKGMYFTNAYSSVDGTILSLKTIFHSLYPIKIGNRSKLTLQKNNLFDILTKNNYEVNGLVPDLKGFSEYVNCFQNTETTYTYWDYMDKMDEFLLNTSSVITEKITDFLKSGTSNTPWFYYIHLMTLHPLKEYFASHKNEKNLLYHGIEDFNSEKYGAGLYERTVSFIDYQIGKILENINLDNTILILTSDHGQSIPYEGYSEVDFQPELENTVSIGKKILPKSAHNMGGKFLYNIRKSVGKRKLEKSNETLTNYEKRSRETFDNVSLFDEMLHIPLLFANNQIKSKIITGNVHHTDILPTLCNLANIKLVHKVNGRNLIPLTEKNGFEDVPIYIRTRAYVDPTPDKRDSKGIRTDEYKYFRFARNPNENVHLYNLKDDPYENENIAKKNKELILQFEEKISEFEKNDLSDEEEVSEEEIEYELKKMGYV